LNLLSIASQMIFIVFLYNIFLAISQHILIIWVICFGRNYSY
jgi:hypothetical protein